MEKESKLGTKFLLVDLIVLSGYYIFCLLLFLSLTGLFKKEFIGLGLAAGFLFFLRFFWKRIEFKKRYLYLFVLIPILFTGILLTEGCFKGDGVGLFLPWAREIVLQERMPEFLENCRGWLNSRMPLMPLFFAGIFSFVGFGHWVIAVLPFFFASATALLIYQWLLEKGVKKKYIIFGVLLLLTNSLFLYLGGGSTQEPFILFFFTAFFYYLEKAQRTKSNFYFLLVFLSAVLAAVSKMTGLILFLPLFFLLVKNKQLKRRYFYSILLTFPLFLWLLRNYLIYDNPLFPFLNEIFKGQYYNLVLTTNQFAQNFYLPFWNNVLTRIAEVPVSLFLLFCPLGILSFYGFWKERKIQYILLFLIFLLTFFLIMPNPFYVRFCLPFLALFIVYAVIGLQELKSRIFLSLLFFLNLWGLFSTKLSLSQSQFIAPVEGMLSNFRDMAQFVYDYRLALALALGLFFFFVISSYRQPAKYLILLVASTYLVKTVSFHLGSWLNIWLPILVLIFVILAWRLAMKLLKEETLRKSVIAFIIVLLVLNSWGLASTYFLAHKDFMFPNYVEAYDPQPAAAREIEKLEGENRDFYIYAAAGSYFTWYHNFKMTVLFTGYGFFRITDLQFRESLTPSEIHRLFKISKIKYIMDNHYKPQLEPFFDKIKSRPDLFEPIFQKERFYVWRVKP